MCLVGCWDHWPHNVVLEGTLDILAVDQSARGVIVDVKTSKEYVRAWLQLGCYVLAYETQELEIAGAPTFIDRVAVAHCPRPSGILTKASVEIHTQPAGEIVKDAWIALNRTIQNIPVSYTHLTLPTTPYV